ncbi:putative CocE/NonD family hydrolase [Microbacterium resistens]|uniref:CocE/NonD family hydrolase n=1 Tax=Microbacterium resistens TaxID=156977 RepID=A0ABU1S7P9_9MICO|nr:CocE/NonD family hydrolase [Microbacterium resistens]MDR6865644.1 putative CocE/NonD family hydrolase [Microbacterium resistens]
MSSSPRPTRPRLTRGARREHRALTRAPGMPSPTHEGVVVDRDIRVLGEDGRALLTDHWHARDADATTLLIRTPYGRDSVAGPALFFAERGHHVVVQSCRGTFGSEGVFDPLHDEASDGRATLRWVRAQPWATGPVHTWGGSYFGVTQWAMCEADQRPDALGIAVSARSFDSAIIYRGGGFAMETVLAWAYALDLQERRPLSRLWAMLLAHGRLRRGSFAIPPSDAGIRAHSGDPAFLRDWIAHSDPGDPWWEPLHFAQDPATIPPVALLAGWQDLFLEGQLDDYAALRRSGVPVRLAVGDWRHGAPETLALGTREALRGFEDPTAGPAVRIEVTGGGGWHELAEWPPPGDEIAWEASADGALQRRGGPLRTASATYVYDPANPTPSAGGRSLNPFTAGRRDQRRRERREDVLVFTGPRLAEDLVLGGTPVVELTLASTNPRADVFVRLCDVDRRGRSLTVTDGYLRLSADAASGERRRVLLDLAPAAHRFAAGHRLRLQASSGAHPLRLRNPGTDDPVRDFSRLIPSLQTVSLGGEDPLLLRLPVIALPAVR